MNPLFLLKLVSELLQDKPTADEINCAKKIIENMVKEYENTVIPNSTNFTDPTLDSEAQQAQQELQ